MKKQCHKSSVISNIPPDNCAYLGDSLTALPQQHLLLMRRHLAYSTLTSHRTKAFGRGTKQDIEERSLKEAKLESSLNKAEVHPLSCGSLQADILQDTRTTSHSSSSSLDFSEQYNNVRASTGHSPGLVLDGGVWRTKLSLF